MPVLAIRGIRSFFVESTTGVTRSRSLLANVSPSDSVRYPVNSVSDRSTTPDDAAAGLVGSNDVEVGRVIGGIRGVVIVDDAANFAAAGGSVVVGRL